MLPVIVHHLSCSSLLSWACQIHSGARAESYVSTLSGCIESPLWGRIIIITWFINNVQAGNTMLPTNIKRSIKQTVSYMVTAFTNYWQTFMIFYGEQNSVNYSARTACNKRYSYSGWCRSIISRCCRAEITPWLGWCERVASAILVITLLLVEFVVTITSAEESQTSISLV